MNKPPHSGPPKPQASSELKTRRVALRLDEFAWRGLELESTRLGVPEEELIGFAIVYYLADVDSGRIARRPPDRLADRPG